MLTLRLSRVGKRKQPIYRLIVSEKGRDPWGRALEILGNYNPRTNPATVTFNAERVKHWLSKGAQASDTVWNLLSDLKIVDGPKRLKVKISKRRKEKLAKKQAA
ncbi:MAG: 30S ribosomal protein S16 [Patescibacteria group bacterium]|jgi:small subunit ribosomal protein S16